MYLEKKSNLLRWLGYFYFLRVKTITKRISFDDFYVIWKICEKCHTFLKLNKSRSDVWNKIVIDENRLSNEQLCMDHSSSFFFSNSERF